MLQHFPENPFPILILIGTLSILLLLWGGIATYLEAPDKLFLLVAEEEVREHIQKQSLISFIFWVSVQTLFLLLFAPLFLAMGLGLPIFGVYLLVLGIAKYVIFRQKSSNFFLGNGLDWDYVIAQESKLKQFFLKGVQKVPGKIWQNLYLRSYLRNGDLFALSLRLIILSLAALIFIEQSWIAVAIVILFNYLLLFQLLALYHAFDYQYLTQLFPVGKGQKEKGLKEILRAIGIFVLILESLIGLLVFKDKILVLALVGASLVLQFLYLPYQLRRLVDE